MIYKSKDDRNIDFRFRITLKSKLTLLFIEKSDLDFDHVIIIPNYSTNPDYKLPMDQELL